MQAAEAMARGIENADRDAEIRCLPMADGGEGTVRALVDATGGTMHAVPVHDPLGRLIEGRFGVLADGATAWSRPPRPAVSPDSTRRNETR